MRNRRAGVRLAGARRVRDARTCARRCARRRLSRPPRRTAPGLPARGAASRRDLEPKVLAHLRRATRLFVQGGHLEAAARQRSACCPPGRSGGRSATSRAHEGVAAGGRALHSQAGGRRRRRRVRRVASAPGPPPPPAGQPRDAGRTRLGRARRVNGPSVDPPRPRDRDAGEMLGGDVRRTLTPSPWTWSSCVSGRRAVAVDGGWNDAGDSARRVAHAARARVLGPPRPRSSGARGRPAAATRRATRGERVEPHGRDAPSSTSGGRIIARGSARHRRSRATRRRFCALRRCSTPRTRGTAAGSPAGARARRAVHARPTPRGVPAAREANVASGTSVASARSASADASVGGRFGTTPTASRTPPRGARAACLLARACTSPRRIGVGSPPRSRGRSFVARL